MLHTTVVRLQQSLQISLSVKAPHCKCLEKPLGCRLLLNMSIYGFNICSNFRDDYEFSDDIEKRMLVRFENNYRGFSVLPAE